MARYFFNVYDGVKSLDRDGTELPSWRAARREAVRLTGTILRDWEGDFNGNEDWRIEVTDDTGLILFVMAFMVAEAPAVPKPRLSAHPQ